MKCPHCDIEFHEQPESFDMGLHGRGETAAKWEQVLIWCPSCHRPTIYLGRKSAGSRYTSFMAYPSGPKSRVAPDGVPEDIAKDFNEAAVVLPHSAQASAALTRRCLQHVLDAAGFKHKDLGKAIEAAMNSGLPSWLSTGLDAVRTIGNFAAHPTKDTNTGAIVPVEPDEAGWNLDVLEQLFDFYYVQPAIAKKRMDDLNEKLASAGKKPMKAPAAPA